MKLYNVYVTLKHSLNPERTNGFQCVILAKDDQDVNNKIEKRFGKQLVKYDVWYDNDIVLIEKN